MPALAGMKKVGPQFTNGEEIYKATYDFAVDGGSIATYDIFEASAACVITGYHAVVKTTATSGGSATVDVGIAADDNLLTAGVAVAALTADAVLKPAVVEGTPNVMPMPFMLAAGGKISMKIVTAALTAGKIDFYVKVQKA